jgi:putative ABC transport system permease protein
MSRLALRLAQRIVRAIALLVPAADRVEWRREWEGELWHYQARLERRRHLTWRMQMNLVRLACGSLPDAAWIRRQFTRDADAVHDMAHAVRMLIKRPGFTAIVLGVFAIGIGAATAIVSVADALFIRPLAVSQPARVVTVWQRNTETGAAEMDVAPANAIDWIARSRSFDAAAIAEPLTFNVNFAGREPDYLPAARVSEQFFRVLGADVLHGRAFLPQEYRRGGPRVAIFSHALWRSRFGADPAVVGTSVRLDAGDAYTVVGVMPPRLELRLFSDSAGARRPEVRVWIPKQGFDEAETKLRGAAFWNLLARLRPGTSVEQAQAELAVIAAQLGREYPQTNARIATQVVPLRAHLAGSFRDVLPVLLGAAAILLIVACANVASLLLARGTARTRELAVRKALGASRARLVRQLLVESLLLAVAGGTVGLALARWTLDVIATLRPADVALLDQIPIDARAAALASGVTMAAALVAGLVPSLQLSRASAVNAIREGRTVSQRGIRSALIIVEVAAALVLVVGAGLLARSFVLIHRVDPGFNRDHVSALQLFVSTRIETPAKRVVFFDQVLERLRELPGVVAAGAVSSMPFGEARVIVRGPVAVVDRPPVAGEESLAYTTAVTGDYFKAMGVPLLAGRLLDGTDTATSREVVLVSHRAAQQFWHGADPIGSKMRFRFSGKPFDAEVVGVVGDVRHEALNAPAAAEVFLPYAQSGFHTLTFVVRASPGSPVELHTLKEAIWALDPLQSIYNTARSRN